MLLLAIQPMRVLGVPLTGLAVGVIVGLAVACFALAGLLRHRWAWPAATGLQVRALRVRVRLPRLARGARRDLRTGLGVRAARPPDRARA